jgi:hypothetical protein
MRIIKLATLSFIFLFLLVTIISFFIPGNITISKATNIPGDAEIVNPYIGKLTGWTAWHPALKDIPEKEFIVFTDTTLKLRNTTINVVERKDEEIVTEMATDGGRPIRSGLKLIRHQPGDSATLQWFMDFKLRWYPWEKFRSLFFENIYGVQMEQGLANLKELSGRRS